MTAIKNFTPREIVSELDRYIIGQNDAKRAVAIALRNRWRRLQVSEDLRDEIAPKNIIMIGPTGVGKTEIARRLAKLSGAPFIKVEASKFTEVGYVGKDVESMIRDLTDQTVKMVKEEQSARLRAKAQDVAEEKVLDLLQHTSRRKNSPLGALGGEAEAPGDVAEPDRDRLRTQLRAGQLDERMIEIEINSQPMQMIEVIAPGGLTGGLEDMGLNLKEMFGNMMPKQKKKRRMKVSEALRFLSNEEVGRLLDMEDITRESVQRVEQSGIVFLDEIDKIAGREGSGHGPDVSREGVQRDILPIVEGSNVTTKYGIVRTDHILFIASGAFHVSKPSDLIPELQGRFPIRVELKSLTKEDFLRILKEPQNSLTKQYTELLKTEGLNFKFTDEALEEIANFSALVNERTENIGARRLHTIMEKVLDEISFTAPEIVNKEVGVDAAYVRDKLSAVVKDVDLSRYIL